MQSILEETFRQWTVGLDPVAARIRLFERIRDIPYAIVPEISNADRFPEILSIGRGSCTPKHLLLADMFGKLGITVLLLIYPFRWSEVEIDFPPDIRKIVDSLPPDHHMASQAEIAGRLVTVDATVDPALARLGLPVNTGWDGFSDTVLAVAPSDEPVLFHPAEARQINSTMIDTAHLGFFNRLNSWLDEVRVS